MPFSWKKKTRCNRFSQLVADHLQSPKRGGSLVVETGFPTSLIDLYVRNRGRFQKSSAKKESGSDSPTPVSPSPSSSSSSLLVDSISFSSSSPSGLLLDSNNLSSGAFDYSEIDEIVEEDVVDEKSSKTEVERSVEIAKLNPVLVVALKILLMAVLAVGTKRFTFWITISAFLLLFLESMGKPLFKRSSLTIPTVDSKSQIESSFQETTNIKTSKVNTTLVCSEVLEIEEQVESKQEVRSEKELDDLKSEVLMEIRHKISRGAIMKSRIKKLVPKKLRKYSMGSKDDLSRVFNEEETMKFAQDLKQEQDKMVETDRPSSLSTLSSETVCNNKELRRESHQNSGGLVLCLIVLVGLIGGRGLALVLALSWCLMPTKLQWRNVKFPIS